jgi:hypothetical protein
MPWRLAPEEQACLFQTTAQVASQQRLAAAAPAPPRARALVTPANALAVLAAHARAQAGAAQHPVPHAPGAAVGDAAAAAPALASAGMPPLAAAAAPSTAAAAERYSTTYRRAMEDGRKSALAARLPPDVAAGPRFPLSSRLQTDTWQQASLCREGDRPGGRGGARGQFTRWPAEGGSRYGVCVWADEYAAGR